MPMVEHFPLSELQVDVNDETLHLLQLALSNCSSKTLYEPTAWQAEEWAAYVYNLKRIQLLAKRLHVPKRST